MTPEPKRLLVVDDEAPVRRLLRRCFEGAGYIVSEAGSGSVMHDIVAKESISLITLDIALGAEDGIELARQIRQSHDIPIIMVTGKGDLIDTVVGLEVGADDYISKPFELREVLARVRAVLRRYESRAPDAETKANSSLTAAQPEAQTGPYFVFNGWRLDTASRELRSPAQESCELTTTQYELLAILVTHARQVLSRDQIMDLLKGHDWSPTDRSIDNQVSKLRKSLNDLGVSPTIIKTVRGAGYLFNAEVTKHGQ